jgi:5'(3')-deoxyribonucleotidase
MRNVLSTLKIGFDLDTILAATDEASISWYQERGLVGPEVTAAQITKWDHSECLGVDPAAMVEMYTSDSFFRNIRPISEAVEIAQKLHHSGAEVHIFTDRPCPAVTAEWLELRRVPYDRLVFMKGEEKPAYAERIGLDFTLEDNPKTAIRLATTVSRLSFLRDRPYNRDAGLHPKLHRFYTFDEIFRFFRL